MKAYYVGVVGLFLLLLGSPNACEAQKPSSEFDLDKKVEQMQIAGRKLQAENRDLKVKNILLQKENQSLRAERAELQKSEREAISLAHTSQMNQKALLAEVTALKKMQEITALRVEIAELRKMLNALLQRKPVARDPKDPFAQEPPKTVAPRTTPPATPRTKPPTTGKNPFGAPSSNSPR